MNRGTALKWIKSLKELPSDIAYDNSQIGFRVINEGVERTYMSPIGVLCNFLDPNGFELTSVFRGDDSVSYMYWHGELFVLPEHWRKKCKIKSQWMDIAISEGNIQFKGSLYEALDMLNIQNPGSDDSALFQRAGEIIEEYFEKI